MLPVLQKVPHHQTGFATRSWCHFVPPTAASADESNRAAHYYPCLATREDQIAYRNDRKYDWDCPRHEYTPDLMSVPVYQNRHADIGPAIPYETA